MDEKMTMTWDEIRDAVKRLEPLARKVLGKSILDCSVEELTELRARNDVARTGWLAARDQAAAGLGELGFFM